MSSVPPVSAPAAALLLQGGGDLAQRLALGQIAPRCSSTARATST
jgi:hypothetical protein